MIVLLTDFGQSEYVGAMKGVVYRISDDARIVDLCHDISPQSIIEASWVLKNNYTYFPSGAIFCCVVDPGVGTARKALAVKTADNYFIGPDNGLLWETVREQGIVETRVIPIPENASRTFHGRDVFARAAADVALGRFEQLGPKTERIERLELYQNAREGIVVRIDRFGNIITNLPAEDKEAYRVKVGGQQWRMIFFQTYHAAPEDELFLIEGSCNTLEISLKNGNACEKLKLKTGQQIEIS
ncbi:MAG: SAM hydrolase/SAM-dependent halogenase family protein [Planctomycetota bacterium]